MRRLLFLNVLVMIMSMCSCSDDNSPSAVVDKACGGILKDDYSIMAGNVYFPDSVEADEVEVSRLALQKLLEMTIRPIMADTDSISRLRLPEVMEALSENIDSSGAVVEVKVTAIGGDFSVVPISLKQDAKGIWRIVNYNDLLPVVLKDSLDG